MPQAVCETRTPNAAGTLIINREKPPFDRPDLRRALALSLDRKGFIDILTEGQGKIGGAMLPPPNGVWGMPPDMLKTLPGYDPDTSNSRSEARRIVEKLGYGPDHRLNVKVTARNIPTLRDPAVILIDQLKEIYIVANSTLSRLPAGSPNLRVGISKSASFLFLAASTTPTSSSMRTMLAGRSAIIRDTAIARLKRCSTSNRSKQTKKSANSWYGRSIRNCRKTVQGQSFITPVM